MSGSRLDPLTLPPATAGRFVLLMVTALAASVQVYGWLFTRLPLECMRGARSVAGDVRSAALIDWYAGCEGWASVRAGWSVVLMIMVFALVTLVIYLSMPVVAGRSLIPLHRLTSDPALGPTAEGIQQFITMNSARRAVPVYVEMASGRGVDRVFGRVGRRALVLNVHRLSPADCESESKARDSVLLHEIAHLRNRDIDLTYLTIAAWWGFLVAVVALPLGAVAWLTPTALGDLSWRMLVVLVLFWLLRASIFRTRELYADVCSADSLDRRQALLETLDKMRRPTKFGVSNWFRYHPSTTLRAETVREPDRLFRLQPSVGAAAGVLVGLGYPPAEYLASLLLPDRVYEPEWICALTFGFLVATVLAGAVWRAALRAAAAPGYRVQTLPAAALFTVSLLGGLLVSSYLPQSGYFEQVVRAVPLVAVGMGILLLILVWGFLRWTMFCASSWLPVTGRPRLAYRFGVLQSGLVLGVWLAVWFQLGGLVLGGMTWAALPGLVIQLINPMLVASIPWACWYPLATWQSRPPHPALRGLRTPLGAVHLTAAGILVAYAVVMIPFYSQLRTLLESQMDSPGRSASETFPFIWMLLNPALALAAAGMFVLGMAAGGRDRLDRALIAAGAATLPICIGLMILMLNHISLASPRSRGLLELLAGLSGIDVGGSLSADRPPDGALGLMVILMFGLLLAIGLPAAALGSLARSVRPAAELRRPPMRSAPITAALTVPMLILGSLIGYLGWRQWRAADATAVPYAMDVGRLEQIFAGPWPTDAPLAESCAGILASLTVLEFGRGTTNTTPDASLARAAAYARSAQDRTLNTMGEGIVESLRNQQYQRALRGIDMANRYCAATRPPA